MRFGYRRPSVRKSLAARTSWKRAVRSKIRAPRGYGWLTNPKKTAYNRVYRRTTRSCSSCLVLVLFFLLITGIMIIWIV